MTTLFDIAWRVGDALGDAKHGTATGGSTTSIVDTVALGGYADDYWNNGGAFIIHDAGDAGAAPENSWSRISDFTSSSATVTLASTLTAVASGDRYMLTTRRYTLDKILASINRALRHLGPIAQVDESLTAASAQTEYAIPASIRDLRQVRIKSYTNDANDNQWQVIYGWRIERAAVGSQDTLILPWQPDANQTIQLVYAAEHDNIWAADDTIANAIDPRLIETHATYLLIRDRLRESIESDPKLRDQLNDARQDYQDAMSMIAPMQKPKKSPHILTIGHRHRRITSGY